MTLSHIAMSIAYDRYLFSNRQTNPLQYFSLIFESDHTITPLPMYELGYDHATTGNYIGLAGLAATWVAGAHGSTLGKETEWTPAEAADTLLLATEAFQYTVYFLNSTSLGATDAIRRQSIVRALQSTINSNQDVKSEMYQYNLMLCPGYPECVDELINLSNGIRNEAFVIADTPMTLNPEDVVNWSNTTGAAPNVRVRSEWGAYYYPHGYCSNLDGNNIVCATSGVALAAYTYSDSVSQVWFAPAGMTRGLVTNSSGVTAVGYVTGTLGAATTFVAVSLNEGQRNALYGSPAFLNPIFDSPGTGIAIWGQRTSVPGYYARATDRVNVVRLAIYIKRSLRKALVQYLFEPNDQITRDSVVALVKSFLHDIQIKRGLYDFAVLCDGSNNTPDRIDRSELWCDIALKPMKAVEFIYVPIRIVNTGAKLTGNNAG
jgi:phage tail sheath protein FI